MKIGMRRIGLGSFLVTATLMIFVLGCFAALRLCAADEGETPSPAAAAHETVRNALTGDAALYYAIAITMVGSCLSASYAVAKVGTAAMAAAAEKPELLGRAIIFVGLAEGIAIYGLIIAIMLLKRG